ncbi:hypothetical protein AB0B74_20925 [Micromonospora parva]|uniref:hypothetical protein n=1 Tax=Micromonospora parva TaxID=1464048 RepID=UPI0033C21759
MYDPDKNTPADAFEVPFGLSLKTCRPTLYLGLAYLGVSGVARPAVTAHQIEPGSAQDFSVFGMCLVISFVIAQALEYSTRPTRGATVVGSVRGDGTARRCNLILGSLGVPVSLLTGQMEWGGHLAVISLIAVCTLLGEVLYHTYGKKNPYRPVQKRSASRPRSRTRTA